MADLRLLIVTGDSASDIEALPAGGRALIDAAGEVMVVTPSLPTRLQWLASDTDKTRELADERLRIVTEQLRDAAAEVHGEVGADDPLLAFEDAVAAFKPDHILIALRSPEDAGWQERGLVDQIVRRFRIPVTAFVLG